MFANPFSCLFLMKRSGKNKRRVKSNGKQMITLETDFLSILFLEKYLPRLIHCTHTKHIEFKWKTYSQLLQIYFIVYHKLLFRMQDTISGLFCLNWKGKNYVLFYFINHTLFNRFFFFSFIHTQEILCTLQFLAKVKHVKKPKESLKALKVI